MIKSYYSLRINSEEFNYDLVSRILNVEPHNLSKGWIYEIDHEGDNYFDFINHFLDILEGKYEKLGEIGITRDDISIWLIYSYHEQCNLEFLPKDMKRLGDNGITLCISCYEGGS